MNVVVKQRDRHTWSLFEDWCTALEYSALPATPNILAHFLDAHPAAVATQRRRITVIDAVHHRTGLPAPGRSETVRSAIDIERAERSRRLAAQLGRIIARLPVTGWPAALFARRDGLILVLASTGMPYSRIVELRICDVSADNTDGSLCVKGRSGVDVATTHTVATPDVVASEILTRWLQVLGHNEAHLSTRLLAEAIAAGDGTELAGYERYAHMTDERPLLTPIDRWGYTPLQPTPLTTRALSDIVRSHLSGHAARHVNPLTRTRDEEGSGAAVPGRAAHDVQLDPAYYERGTAARRNASSAFAEVDVLLDDVEERAEQLLADLLDLIGKSEPNSGVDLNHC